MTWRVQGVEMDWHGFGFSLGLARGGLEAVEDAMLSSIAPEVNQIIQNC